MRNLKRARLSVLACLLIAVMVLTSVFSVNTLAEEATSQFTGTTLTLTDGTNIRFVGTLVAGDETDAVVEYTLSGETKTAEVTVDDNGNFTADIPVGAAQMNETVSASLLCGGEVKDTATQSVRAYAAYQLANGNALVKSLVSELLRYGEEAYKYTNEGASSTLLDGLALSEALTFPASPVYTYTKDATNTFTKIQLTLTDALRLTLKNAAGDVAVKETVKISQFFEGITATAGEASVTASASLYANMKQGDAEVGALVKALYNYAAAVQTALTHVHTLDGGVYTAATKTLTYTCTGCGESYGATTVFNIDQFTDGSNKFYGASSYYLLMYIDPADVEADNAKQIKPSSKDGKLSFIKNQATYGYNSSKNKTGAYLLNFNTHYTSTDGSNNKKMVFGFDLTMPEAGFSSAADGETLGRSLKLTGNAGGTSMLNYNIALKGNKLIAAASGAQSNPQYIDVYTFAPGETRNVVVSHEFITVDESVIMEIIVYIDGEEKVRYNRDASKASADYFAHTGSRIYFDIDAPNYHKTGVGTGVILDNMYIANDFTGFAE